MSVNILPPLPSFLRGYNSSSFTMSVVLRNMDPAIEIVAMSTLSGQNFVIDSFLSQNNASFFNRSSRDILPVAYMPTDPSFAQQGISIASNLVFNVAYPSGLLIPKQQCSKWIWLCLQVYPGFLASYRLHVGYSLIQCVNISSLVNCAGECTAFFYVHSNRYFFNSVNVSMLVIMFMYNMYVTLLTYVCFELG